MKNIPLTSMPQAIGPLNHSLPGIKISPRRGREGEREMGPKSLYSIGH
ncbi:MAG: hypothetical protein QQW96_19920 [Tychonema bourrellyi B0820]|nr:hypothetical protein [Tychonema bourrellyi B0820]